MRSWSSVLAEAGLEARLLVPARRLEEREARKRLPSGVGAVDGLLGGGWPRGGLAELAGPRGSGRTAVTLASLAAALRAGEAVALVDVGGGLDVRSARRAGLALEGLLWIRCEMGRALAAAEIVIDAGGFGLVVLDAGDVDLRAPTAAWQRLKRAADQHDTALVVSAPRRPAGALGQCALTLAAEPRFGGGPRAPRLLLGLDARAELARGAAAAANDDGTAERERALRLVR